MFIVNLNSKDRSHFLDKGYVVLARYGSVSSYGDADRILNRRCETEREDPEDFRSCSLTGEPCEYLNCERYEDCTDYEEVVDPDRNIVDSLVASSNPDVGQIMADQGYVGSLLSSEVVGACSLDGCRVMMYHVTIDWGYG